MNEIPGYVVDQAVKKGADDVVCTAYDGTRNQVRFANSEISISKSWESMGVVIFIAKDKKIMYTSVNDLNTLDKTMDDMMAFLKVMQPSKSYEGIAQGRYDYPESDFDKRLAELDTGLVDLTAQAIDSALASGANRVAGVVYSSYGTQYLATSGGARGRQSGADLDISLRAFASKEASGHSVRSVNDLDDLDPIKVGQEAGEMAKASLDPVIGNGGKFEVLFTPLAFANFLERAAGSASAGLVDAGLSFFKDKVGESVATDQLTMVDDATNKNIVVSPAFDNEGVPTQKNIIIEKGIFKGYLHNTSTAKQYGAQTTGNSGLIFPHTWNCAIEPGTITKDDMIADIQDGLYITNLWYTRFQNHQTGDFSTIPRDAIFRIKDGQLAGAVKDIRISENMLNILANIKHIGNDPQQIRWWEVGIPVITPHVVVKDVNITRSTQ